ncbi:patched domain-containing protein 3-like [Convolutriloba macropyga]|uniref:patched domain-containing protein 3-like n=1 Tax=Convolutriloba macropyga TaxID=536237 RepID=UPI003F5220AD
MTASATQVVDPSKSPPPYNGDWNQDKSDQSKNRSDPDHQSSSAEVSVQGEKDPMSFLNCGCLERLSDVITSSIEKVFYKIGTLTGTRPWASMLIVLAFFAFCMLGVLRWKTENDNTKLWVPRDSRAWDDKRRASVWFPQNLRRQTFLTQHSNVLTATVLSKALELDEKIKNDIEVKGQKYSELCYKTGATTCLEDSLLQLWSYNSTVIASLTDQEIKDTINTDPVISPVTGKEVNVNLLLSGIQNDSTGILSAELMLANYFLEVDNVQEPPQDVLDFETQFLDFCQDGVSGVTIYCASDKSFSDIGDEAIAADITLLIIGYNLVIIYIMVMTGRFNCRDQKAWLAYIAILCVGISVGISFGGGAGLGFDYGPLHSVLPFLLLGVGVDDMFVYVAAWDNLTPHEQELPLTEKIALMTKHAGVSVLVTSLTDFVAFTVGAITVIPALRSFCMYSAMGILGLFLSTLLFFGGAFTFDSRRAAQNRNACLCCIKHGDDYKPNECSQRPIAPRVFEKVASVLTHWPVKVLVVLISCGLVAVSGYGVSKLESNFNPDWFIPDDNYYYDYLQVAELYFPDDGNTGFVYFGQIDYYSKADELIDTSVSLEQAYGVISESVDFFLPNFKEWLSTSSGATLGVDGWTTTESDFYSYLSLYLSGDGESFSTDVQFTSDNTTVQFSRYRYRFQRFVKSSQRMDAMDETRAVIDSISGLSQSEAFTVNDMMVFTEGDKIMLKELFRNVMLAFLAVLVVNLLLIANIVTCLLVLLCVVLTIVDVAGMICFWGLDVNFMTAINIILSIGLAVDYAAHIGHSFMIVTGNRQDRMKKCLVEMGVAVFNGGFSTFLAFLPLAGSESYVFKTFFRTFFLVSVIGLYHGLLFLPVTLSLIGPPPYLSVSNSNRRQPSANSAKTAKQGDASNLSVANPVLEPKEIRGKESQQENMHSF